MAGIAGVVMAETIRHEDGRTEVNTGGPKGTSPEAKAIREAAKKLQAERAERDAILAEQLKRIKSV